MFYFSQSLFFREIYKTSFFAAVKDKFANIEKPALTNPTFFVFSIHIPLDANCTVKILEDFTEENSRLSQIKQEKVKKHLFGHL